MQTDIASVNAFLDTCAARGVLFHIEGDSLRTRAPQGAISGDDAAYIRGHREAIKDCVAARSRPSRRPLQARAADDDAPRRLSLAQERFWFMNRLAGGAAQYNMPVALQVRGVFDADAAEQALQLIVDRHETVRSVFVESASGNGLEQCAVADSRFCLQRMDLRALSPEIRQQQLAAAMHDNATAAFDLSKDLLLRGSFVQLAADEGALLLCMPHIASDGWSFLVMEREFVSAYRQLRQGQPPQLPPLAISYTDYVDWQRDWLGTPDAERQLGYWEEQLRELPPLHGLTLDRPRSEQLAHPARWHGWMLPGDLTTALKALALQQRTTLFMVLHAAFCVLLSRHGATRDVVIGTPVMNRLHAALEPLVGCFVNTLVLRADCDPALCFKDFLQQIKQVNLEAQAHQEITFEQVVERLRPPRSALHTPLFQIMFSMGMPIVARERQIEEFELSRLAHEGATAKFELSLFAQEFIQESGADLELGFEYDGDLFDAASIERLGGGLQTLLEQIVADPAGRLGALDPQSPEQRQQQLMLSQGPAAMAGLPCLHLPIEAQAAARPDQPALIWQQQVLDYGELNARANRLARRLRQLGVGPDVRVGLCLQRSLDLGVAILAVWKAGGAYVPLDPSHPAPRLQQIIDDAEPACLVGHRASLERLGGHDRPTLALDQATTQTELAMLPAHNLDIAAIGLRPEHLAYVIFTSGSTGRPKGVMVEHRHVAQLGVSLQQALASVGADGARRWAWNASFAFDASLKALLQWQQGSTLVLLSQTQRRDPVLLRELIETGDIEILDATPLQVETLFGAWPDDASAQQALPTLVIGGEAISPALWQRIAGCQRRALNVYGPTEATVDATAAVIEGVQPVIGRPLAGVRTYVVNQQGALQLPGVSGELVIGGNGVSRGYLRRGADAAAETMDVARFVMMDLGHGPERVYRTGDQVRCLSDGRLEYLGRGDGQVKIRGYRLDLEDIAAPLRACQGVAAVAVTAPATGADGARQLWAYVVPTAATQATPSWLDGIRSRLVNVLPDYMVPARILALEQLPLSPNGKLDLAALPTPERTHETASGRRPQRPVEQLIAGLWAQLLNVSEVCLDDNLFDLGGQSILAARMSLRLEKIFRRRIPLALFFDRATVAGLCAVLDELLDRTVADQIAELYLQVAAMDATQVHQDLARQVAV